MLYKNFLKIAFKTVKTDNCYSYSQYFTRR
jgi:hypothetical protein